MRTGERLNNKKSEKWNYDVSDKRINVHGCVLHKMVNGWTKSKTMVSTWTINSLIAKKPWCWPSHEFFDLFDGIEVCVLNTELFPLDSFYVNKWWIKNHQPSTMPSLHFILHGKSMLDINTNWKMETNSCESS